MRRLRPEFIAVVALIILTFVSWIPRHQGPIDLRLDAGVYYVLGTSLAQGSGYRLLNEPGSIEAVQYPPLVPAIIALEQKVLGSSDPLVVGTALKRLWFAFFLLFIILVYCCLRLSAPVPCAFACAVFCLLNAQLCFYSNQCSAEIPFAVLSGLFVLIYRKRRMGEAVASVVAVAAFFCRTIGIALFVAWIADALSQRQLRRAALRSVLAIACILVWTAYIRSVEKSADYEKPAYTYQRAPYLFYNVSYARNTAYKDPFQPELGGASFRDRLTRLADNMRNVPESLGEAATTYKGLWEVANVAVNDRIRFRLLPRVGVSAVRSIIGWVILGGTIVVLGHRKWFLGYYLLLTLLLACCAPWQQISRYAVPIAPLLLVTLIECLMSARSYLFWRRQWAHLFRGLIYVGILFLFTEQAGSYYYVIHTYSNPESYHNLQGTLISFPQFTFQDQDIELQDATNWIKAHAHPNDIIAAAMPQWVYLKTGLKSVMPPFVQNPNMAKRLLDSVPVRYLIVEDRGRMGTSARDHMVPMLDAFPREWPMVYVSQGRSVRVFERSLHFL